MVGKGTDLSFSVDGRTWDAADGRLNMPDGEIATAPVESTLNGCISFDFPGVLGGRLVNDIRLRWEEGKLVEASASTNQDFSAFDPRHRPRGQPHRRVRHWRQPARWILFCNDILLDEKIGGTIHIALGRAYPQVGGTNQSAIHWDIVKDMRQEGGVFLDGKLIYSKMGKFLDLRVEDGRSIFSRSRYRHVFIERRACAPGRRGCQPVPACRTGSICRSLGFSNTTRSGSGGMILLPSPAQLLQQSGIDPKQIAAVGAQRHRLLRAAHRRRWEPAAPGDPVRHRHARLSGDRNPGTRAGQGGNFSAQRDAPELAGIRTKGVWIRRHEPEVFRKARWFLTSQAYLVYKLTGQASIDIYTAGGYIPLFDVFKREWVKETGSMMVSLDRLPAPCGARRWSGR